MKSLTEFSDLTATRQVIGCIMLKPELIQKYNIDKDDFAEKLYQYVFLAIAQLYHKGAKLIDAAVVMDYLKQYDTQYKNFQHNNGFELLQRIEETTEEENFAYNIAIVKKFALLRDYTRIGIDVSEFFDPDDFEFAVKEKKRKLLENSSVADIIMHFKVKMSKVNAKYEEREDVECKKAGVGGLAQLERWKETTAWGLGYASAYLNTIVYGIRQRRYTIKSASSGTGKTRTQIADIAHAFSPYYYDKKSGKWCRNPNGIHNKVLYIGTEMELLEEIEPILYAYIADVPQEHIEFNMYEDDEEERVKLAVKILEKTSFIYLALAPDYDIETLTSIIEEHKIEHGITSVFFDYIMPTGSLIAEYTNKIKGHMAVREDQVLLELSKAIKNICRKYNVSFDTCTQVSGEFKNIENRDETIVRGAKALVDKADIGIIAMPPTEKELKMIDHILNSYIIRGDKKLQCPLPNLVYSIYKNRGGKYKKMKIWLYIEYSTMRVHDLFVTGYDYKIIKDFPRVYINEKGVTYDHGDTIYVEKSEIFNKVIDDLAAKKEMIPDYDDHMDIENDSEEHYDKHIDEEIAVNNDTNNDINDTNDIDDINNGYNNVNNIDDVKNINKNNESSKIKNIEENTTVTEPIIDQTKYKYTEEPTIDSTISKTIEPTIEPIIEPTNNKTLDSNWLQKYNI